jgi:hypothetical protein
MNSRINNSWAVGKHSGKGGKKLEKDDDHIGPCQFGTSTIGHDGAPDPPH